MLSDFSGADRVYVATRELPHMNFVKGIGAGRRTRTPDLLITNQLLYQLSYTSISRRLDYNSADPVKSQAFFQKNIKNFWSVEIVPELC